MKKKHSKLLTMLLVIAMIFTMTPFSAFAAEEVSQPIADQAISSGTEPEANRISDAGSAVDVFLSISDDAQFLKGKSSGDVMALKKIQVPYFDLALYGLEDFYFVSEKYEPGSLGQGTAETAKDKVTMLHLYIYATEIYYCGLSPEQAGKGYLKDQGLLGTDVLRITGSAGSTYVESFWGMDPNMNYYCNYEFPRANAATGATADQVLLRNYDIVTIGHFKSYDFYQDSTSVFNYIIHGGNTVETSASQGDKLDMSLKVAGSGSDFVSTAQKPVTSCPDIFFAPVGMSSGDVTSWTKIAKADDKGNFVLDTSKMEPGKYVVAVAGQKGLEHPNAICSTPGGIVLNLAKSEKPAETVIYKGTDWPFKNYYYVEQLILKGPEVERVEGTDVYLPHTTAKDAELSFEVKAGGRLAKNLGINWNDDSTNTKTYSTKLVNGKATVKIKAYKASGAGVSRQGTKTFKIHIAEPNNVPTLADGFEAESNANMPAGETFKLDLSKVFADKDGDELKYTVSINDAKAVDAKADYSFTEDTPGVYKLKFTATDGKTAESKIPVHTVTLTVTNSEKTYAVKINAPKDVSPKFFAVNEIKEGNVVKGEALTYENGTVTVPENIDRIMWEADGMTGFSAPVSAGGELKLVKVSFDSKGKTKVDDSIKSDVEIIDKDGVKVKGSTEKTYLLPAISGFTYKFSTTEPGYGVLEMTNQTPEEGVVEFKLKKKHFTVIAPKGSVASAGTLSGSFKYSFAEPISHKTEGDTEVYEFAPLSGNAFVRIQKPDDKDAVTYWDWRSSKADGKTITVTEKDLFMKDDKSDKFDADTVYRNFEQYSLDLGDIYMNINNQGYVNLNVGETKGLNMFRNWQAIESFSNSKISLPDFDYEIINIDGDNVISIDPEKNNSAAATLTAKGEGTAIVLVTYDAMYSDSTAQGGGGGAGGGNRLSAIWPDRTGVFVVSVGKDGTKIKSNMTCNGAIFDAEHSPQFYTGNAGAKVSFKPEAGVEVTVNRSTVGKETLSFGEFTKDGIDVAEDGTVTVSGLKTGRHIIRFEKDGVASYQVVTAQETEVNYFDAEGKNMGEKPVFTPGEKITIKIKGLTNPAEKFATKYNFNAQLVYKDEAGNTYKNSSGTGYGRYDFSSTEQVIEVQVPADFKGDKITLNGAIQMGGFAGDGIGSHRKVSYGKGSGMATGTSAGMTLGTLPELVVYNKAHDHSFVNEVVDDKYLAAEADFNHGKAYYKSCTCGEAGTEMFYVGESLGAQIKAKAKKDVADYKNINDYREEQKAELQKLIDSANDAIDGATSEKAVNKAVADAKAAMDKVKTDAQLDKEEADAALAAALAKAKSDGIDEVENYKNPADYREAQKAELAGIVEVAKDAINAAADKEAVAKAVADAKAAMDKVKTDAQLEKEETEEKPGTGGSTVKPDDTTSKPDKGNDTKPDDNNKQDDNKKDEGVATGDENNPVMLLTLMGMAGAAMYTARRKYNK